MANTVAAKTERQLNLVICLLAARRFLPREHIRRAVPQYAQCPTAEAFERMFERDKDELRALGVPLRTGSADVWFDDEIGYRIEGEDYALPEVSFEPAEMAVLGLAARAWQQAAMSHAAGTALLKLRAAGVDPDESAIVGVQPWVKASEPAFAPLWAAVRDARPVRFNYRRPGAASEPRRVEPWGVLSRNGSWYLVGHDRDRGATRVFRLSRVDGPVQPDGAAHSVVVPTGTAIRDQLTRIEPAEPTRRAEVAVRTGSGLGLRRRAAAQRPAPEPGWDHLEVAFGEEETLAEELASYGSAVVALSPPEVRAGVVRRLRAVLDRQEATR